MYPFFLYVSVPSIELLFTLSKSGIEFQIYLFIIPCTLSRKQKRLLKTTYKYFLAFPMHRKHRKLICPRVSEMGSFRNLELVKDAKPDSSKLESHPTTHPQVSSSYGSIHKHLQTELKYGNTTSKRRKGRRRPHSALDNVFEKARTRLLKVCLRVQRVDVRAQESTRLASRMTRGRL